MDAQNQTSEAALPEAELINACRQFLSALGGKDWEAMRRLVAPHATPLQVSHDKGWILLTFAIFNTYMLILSSQVNLAVFVVFLTLELTEILLAVGNFTSSPGWTQFGGYLGIITAAAAWYTSAAGVSNGLNGKLRIPVGRPLI